MSVEVSKFQVDDLNYLDAQGRQRELVDMVLEFPGRAQRCMVSEWSFTFWSAEGRALCCTGVFDSEVWAFMAKDLKNHMISIARRGRREFNRYQLHTGAPLLVDCLFPEAVRLARALGCRPLGGKHWIFDEKCANSTPPLQ